MNLGLEGRVALVTGASKGLGHACAAALAEEGATVVITSRSIERAQAAAATIGAVALAHDSTDLDAVPALIARVEVAHGPKTSVHLR